MAEKMSSALYTSCVRRICELFKGTLMYFPVLPVSMLADRRMLLGDTRVHNH